MGLIVNEVARNVSATNGFYRVEDSSLSYTSLSYTATNDLSTARSWSPTFANAGNCRGVFTLIITAGSTYPLVTRDVSVDLEETKGTCTFTIATERINCVGHGLNDGDKVRFSTTGALVTGLTVGRKYYVINKTANDYQVELVLGSGTAVLLSGTASGTATHWVTRSTATVSETNIRGTELTYGNGRVYGIGFKFGTPYAVDTTASKWRFTAYQSVSSTTSNLSWAIGYKTATTIPFYVTWCDTAVSYSDTNDMIVSLDTLTIDTASFSPKAYSGNLITATAQGICGIVGTPVNGKRGWNTNSMLTVTDATHTINIDGFYVISSQSGVYIGTEANPLVNTTTINFTETPTIGNARYSCFVNWDNGGSYTGGATTYCFSGTPPPKRFATLTADALNGQKDVVVDDATGFTIGDNVYLSKHDIAYSSTSDATLYEIGNIVGNTVTMTTNISTTRLGPTTTTHGTVIAGGKMVRVGGYSVILQSTVVTGGKYAHGIRCHAVSNIFMQGCWIRGLCGTFNYAITQRAIDVNSNLRPAGSLFKYNLVESPIRGSTNIGFLDGLTVAQLHIYIEDNIGCFQSIAGAITKGVYTPATGVTFKTGDMYFRRNLTLMSGSVMYQGTGSANAKVISEDNISHGTLCGNIISQTNSESNRNVSYGCYVHIYVYTNFNCISYRNVMDRCTSPITFASASISSGSMSVEDEFTNPGGYLTAYVSDLLYDYLFQDCVGNLTLSYDTFQANMVIGTKFRYVNNNKTANADYTYTSNGVITRCGTALADTTVHTAGGYSMRFAPIDSTTILNWEQFIPTGNIQNKEMTVSCWVKINNANFYTGVTNQLPKLHIKYDNATEVYAQAAETTDWQLLAVTFTPTTTFGQITMKVDCATDALTTDKYVYMDDITVFYPAGVQLNLGAIDIWANALPVTPTISTNVTAADIWAAQEKSYGANTMGTKLKKLKNASLLIDNEVIV